MSSFEDFDSSSRCSDETVESCTTCANSGILEVAVRYCAECCHYYCQRCIETHNKDHEQHELIDHFNGFFTGETSMLTERCLIHRTELLDKYCMDHNDIGCRTCVALEHRSCTHIRMISDVVQNSEKTLNHVSFTEKLRTLKARIGEIKTNKENLLRELQTSTKQAIYTVKSFRKELEDELAKLEKASIVEIEKEYNAQEVLYRNQLKDAQDHIEKLQKVITGLKIPDRNKVLKFISIKTVEKVLKSSEQVYQTLSTSPQQVNIGFELNQNIYNSLKELRLLGQVRISSNNNTKQTSYKVQNFEDIKVNVTDESWSFIQGSCCTYDGLLILSDMNSKLKRVDVCKKRRVVDYCDLPAVPWGVCCTGLHEAAVCLSNKTVQKVSLENDMMLSTVLTFPHRCYGVAYNNGELFISDHMESVYVYDSEGNPWRKISLMNKVSGGLLAFDETTNKLHIAAGDFMLTCDRYGNYLSTFADPDLKGLRDVYTDGNGRVYLCGLASNKVIRLGTNGRKNGEIVIYSHRQLPPSSVCFNFRDNKLCVFYPGSVMKVFDLAEHRV